MLSNLVFLLAAAAAAPAAPDAALTISQCDLGDRYQFEVASCSIELRNNSDKRIRVSKVEARYPEDSIKPDSVDIPPRSVTYMEATIDTGNREGLAYHTFRFILEGRGRPQRTSGVNVYVQSVLDQVRPKFDFGTVHAADAKWPLTQSVTFSSREVRDLRVTRVEEAPEWLDVSIGDNGRKVSASLKKDVPWGLKHAGSVYVKVGLNTPRQPHAWIAVTANVLGDVVPDGNPFQLGMMRTNGKHEFLMRLSSPEGKDFKLGKIVMRGIKGKVLGTKACVPAATGCRLVRLSIDNKQPIGKLIGKLDIDLPELGKTLPVELFGILLSPETKIHELSELQSASPVQSEAVSEKLDVGSALVNAVKPEEAPLPGRGPLLRWSVAHQTRIYGYAIYRAESEDGPLLRVNKEIIPVSQQGADRSGSYQWRDESAEAGKTYWYQIGNLNRDGAREDLSGRQKVVAK